MQADTRSRRNKFALFGKYKRFKTNEEIMPKVTQKKNVGQKFFIFFCLGIIYPHFTLFNYFDKWLSVNYGTKKSALTNWKKIEADANLKMK